MLIYMSLSGGILIAWILLFRLLLQKRVHRSVWLILWAVAVLRLLLPMTVAAPTSIWNVTALQKPVTVIRQTVQQAPAQQQPAAVQNAASKAGVTTRELLMDIWLLGAGSVFTVLVISHLRNRLRFRRAIPISLEIAVPKRVQLRVLDGVGAPLTYGLIRPVILLPTDGLTENQQLPCVLAHELSHIRHWDILKKAFLLLTLSVHWFNPLVWVMVSCASQDMEMRCDADAVKAVGGRKKYAEALLHAEQRKLMGVLQTGFSFCSTEQRIRAIAKDHPKLRGSLIAVLLMAVLIVPVFATGRMPQQLPLLNRPVQSVMSELAQAAFEQKIPTQKPQRKTEPEPIQEVPAEETQQPEQQTEETVPQPSVPQQTVPQQTAPPQQVFPIGSTGFLTEETRTVYVGSAWTELYSDNPAVLRVGGVYQAGDGYQCEFTARAPGTANVYYRMGDNWMLFASVTVTE